MWICQYDGMANDDKDAACILCGNPRPDASQEMPAEEPQGEPEAEPSVRWVLVLTDIRSGVRIVVDRTTATIGREGDYVTDQGDLTVSRQHLLVRCREGAWHVRHLGLNDTVVYAGGATVTLTPALEYPLTGGETLKLGASFFDVTIEDLAPQATGEQGRTQAQHQEQEPQEDAGTDMEGWFCDCPVCGAAILVEDATSQVRSCPRCTDAFDRRRVARVRPVFGTRPQELVVDGV